MSKIVGVGHGPRISPVPSSVQPLLEENFDGHASVAAYLDTLPSRGLVIQEDRMAFDPAGFGGSSQSLRYDFPDKSADTETRCNNTTIGYLLDLRPHVADEETELQDLWLEVWYKFDVNWTTQPDASWSCATPSPDYKMVFGAVLGGGGRFQFKHGQSDNFRYVFGAPGDSQIGGSHPVSGASDEWDGQWYQMRMRMKVSSATDVADGRLVGWLSGTKVVDETGVVNRTKIYGIEIGRNRNHGAVEDMSVYFGSLKVWNQQPAWDS